MSQTTGMHRHGGRLITEAEHIRQSVADILSTPLGTRVQREDYGSLIPELLDHPQTPALDLRLTAAAFMAIVRWETRIKPTRMRMAAVLPGGQRTLELEGVTTQGQTTALTVPLAGATA